MYMTKEKLSLLISQGRESTNIDFKREFYKKLKESELPKDIAAFANVISNEPKVLVFGVDDGTREVVGIENTAFTTQDDLDNYISEKIEPFVSTEVGLFEINNHTVGYIEVLDRNNDRPYVIKNDCGHNSKISKGEIFIRKGSSIQKATRSDLDDIYKKGKVRIKIHDSVSIVEPIHFEGELIKDPTFGRINLELYNGSNEPVLIDDGCVCITSSKHSVCRGIYSIMPINNIRSRPFELTAKERIVRTILYDFLSEDCLNFEFDSDGYLDEMIKIKIELFDTDGNIYNSDEISVGIIAKGDILHKVQLKDKKAKKSYK